VHDPGKLRRLTREIVDGLSPLPNGCTLLTIAPETVEPELITELTRKGFIVSCGHSNANQKQVKEALNHGMRGFTPLFNAMSQLTAREPGVVGQALADQDSWCGIIVDGHHVSPVSLEIAWCCKGADRLMLVTDAMPPVGSPKKEFILLGNRVTVQDGICLDETGTLAGTALDMISAVRNMDRLTRCTFADACIMASSTPAAFLGVADQRGSITAGRHADLVIVGDDYSVRSTIIGGQADR
jgi:N-acetylglucosamine-6-phosphate deacetylase